MVSGVERALVPIWDRPGHHEEDAFYYQQHGVLYSLTLKRGLSCKDSQDHVSEQTPPCHIFLMSSCPILASSLQRCLSDPASGIRFRSQTFSDVQELEHPVETDPCVLLIAPQSWLEAEVSSPESYMAANCTHLDEVNDVTPSADGCEECLAMGDTWVHRRLYLTCGHRPGVGASLWPETAGRGRSWLIGTWGFDEDRIRGRSGRLWTLWSASLRCGSGFWRR
jgi:hypothetical protein